MLIQQLKNGGKLGCIIKDINNLFSDRFEIFYTFKIIEVHGLSYTRSTHLNCFIMNPSSLTTITLKEQSQKKMYN